MEKGLVGTEEDDETLLDGDDSRDLVVMMFTCTGTRISFKYIINAQRKDLSYASSA